MESISQSQCQIQMEKTVCHDVDPKYKKGCIKKDNMITDIINLIGGCIAGNQQLNFWYVEFLWTMMQGLYSLTFEGNSGINKEASAVMQSARNYLNIQYEQAYKETSPPNRILKNS